MGRDMVRAEVLPSKQKKSRKQCLRLSSYCQWLELWRSAAAVVVAAMFAGARVLGAGGISAAAASAAGTTAASAGIVLRAAIVMVIGGRLEILDGIIIVVGVLIVTATAARTVEVRAHLARWARRFWSGLKSHAAGEASADQHGFAHAFHGLKLYHAFTHVNFRETGAVHFHVKRGATDGNHGAGRANL